MIRRSVENRDLQTAQMSDLCRRRLLSYADSFYELARSYDREFALEGASKQTMLMEKKLWENRQVIRRHLKEMAKIMTEAACDVLVYTPMEKRKKRQLIQLMAEENICVENPCYLPREDGRIAVMLTMSTRKRERIATEDVADMISVILDKRLKPVINCPYTVDEMPQSFVLEQETAYVVMTGFARAVKEDETISGDNYAVVETEDGHLVTMLSDGTGSGEIAGKDSGRVLDLMEKMLEAGYGTDAAVNMVNTALFSLGEDKNHPTLDICEVNLYHGSCCLKKIGGAVTFLKSGNDVELISTGSLPLGVFQEVETDTVTRQLQDGDYLIMVTDGVVDAFRNEEYEDTIAGVLTTIQDSNPGEIAERLLRIALKVCGGKIRDDMTIGVMGIWKT